MRNMHTVYTINKKNKQMVIGLVREYFESNGFEIYKFENHKLHFIKKINSNKRYPRIHFKIIITSKGLSVWCILILKIMRQRYSTVYLEEQKV